MGWAGAPPDPRRLTLERQVATIAIAVGVLVGGSAFGGLLFLWFLGPGLCHGCPGGVPLGAILSVGNGMGICVAGNGSSRADCEYHFALNVSRATGSPTLLTASELTFRLENTSGVPTPSAFRITVAATGGCETVPWNSSNAAWGSSPASGACSLSAPLETGDTLLLKAMPAGGLPYSQGYQLVILAPAGGFVGEVLVPLGSAEAPGPHPVSVAVGVQAPESAA
jgi:hypothetical protein